jgi:peptidoglycan/LPS O-acetylase OafA/YrhL
LRTLEQSFDPRRNSLNFLRLMLALTVVVTHALPLAAFAVIGGINGTGFGEIAVYGFFGLSGYLIAGSAGRTRSGRFLWHRFLRIFPAYWVCLIVTAFVFGPIAWVHNPPTLHCDVACYFSATNNSPYGYIYRNLFLVVHQTSIAGTPRGSLEPLIWNGSLWSLSYEFLCYLLLMGLAMAHLLKHRFAILAMTGSLWLLVFVITLTPALNHKFNLFENYTEFDILKLTTTFFVGAVIYLFQDSLPDSGWLALVTASLFVGCLFWPTGGENPSFSFTASDLLIPLMAYPLLWLGIHLPFHRIGKENDYSYGVYIYGFPIAQLLVIFGVEKWGIGPYAALAILSTALLAILSWWVIEKRALRLKALRLPSRSQAALRLNGDADGVEDRTPTITNASELVSPDVGHDPSVASLQQSPEPG